MTQTIVITAADVGTTIAIGPAAMTELRFLLSGVAMFERFVLVDDAPPWDVVPKQLFASDLLDAYTNKNNFLQSPYGVLMRGNFGFGRLFAASVPTNSKFEVDVTSGALSAVEIEEQRRLRDERRRLPAAVTTPDPPGSILLMNRLGIVVLPEPPPPGPDPELVVASRRAAEMVAAERAARASATGPMIVGPCQAEIEFGLVLAVRQQQAERLRSEEYFKGVAERQARFDMGQVQATELLKRAGFEPRGSGGQS
jgi:hypothetical protein